MTSELNHVILMPWLGLQPGQIISYGDVFVRPWEDLRLELNDEDVRGHLDRVIKMYHTSPSSDLGGAQKGVGIVFLGEPTFGPLGEADRARVDDFRAIAFLGALSSSVHRTGPNGAQSILTAENFDLVFYSFVPGQERISEQSGILVQMHAIGNRIATTKYVRPQFVPSPIHVDLDTALLKSLEAMPRGNKLLVRRIVRAADAFRNSYYNTPSLDKHARVLLQAAAFEILLDLPEQFQRLVFKNRVEELLASPGERKYACVYRVHGKSHPDQPRTVYGLWADHFYQLRNGIVHGESLGKNAFHFRHGNHHLQDSQHIFIGCVKAVINEAYRKAGRKLHHADLVFYERGNIDDDDDERPGFRTRIDWTKVFS